MPTTKYSMFIAAPVSQAVRATDVPEAQTEKGHHDDKVQEIRHHLSLRRLQASPQQANCQETYSRQSPRKASSASI